MPMVRVEELHGLKLDMQCTAETDFLFIVTVNLTFGPVKPSQASILGKEVLKIELD